MCNQHPLGAKLQESETAIQQVEALGFSADDVCRIVPAHLDLDQIGGIKAIVLAQFETQPQVDSLLTSCLCEHRFVSSNLLFVRTPLPQQHRVVRLCTYARDSILRSIAPFVLSFSEGVAVEREALEDVMGVEVPQRSQRYREMHQAAQEYYKVLQQTDDADENEKVVTVLIQTMGILPDSTQGDNVD